MHLAADKTDPTGLRADFLPIVAFSAALAGCNGAPVEESFVVRLGAETLTQQELSEALAGVTVEMDSTDAARQVVEQWITNNLLFAEARRRGIDRDPDVQSSIEEAERAVLVDALLEQLYQEADQGPTDAEIQAYFEDNRDRLRLVEPYVRLRYMSLTDREAADAARAQVNQVAPGDVAEWEELATSLSEEPDLSIALSRALVPETRVFDEYPGVNTTLRRTQPGRTSPVIADRGRFHIVQVVERQPAGTAPERAWIEASLRQQLRIESRKLLYARLVQRLRNEALAREQLQLQ